MSNNLRENMIRALYSSSLRLTLLGLLLLAGVTSARADGLNFVLSDGTQTMSWTLPSMPVPSSSNFFSFTINGVTVTEFNGTTTSTVTANIAFYNQSGNDGGISACATSATCDPLSDLSLFNTFDYQTFSGTTGVPTFATGTYTEPATEDEVTTNDETDSWAFSGGNDVPNLTLTIPEPSSMLLLSIGLVGMLGVARRKLIA